MSSLTVKTYPVTGMSCATCALNVEKALKKQPGVADASVNYANASARVAFTPEGADLNQIQSAVRSIGYDIIVDDSDKGAENDQLRHYQKLKTNMTGAIALALPVMIISMFFMNMPYANFIMLVLTLPVLIWFGRSFFRNAFNLARHGQSNMDTLVALSTGIAFLFSLFNTIFPEFWHRRGLHPHVYYEASTVIIAFILIGRVLEEGAKAKTSAAIKKLMGLQPEEAVIIDDAGNEMQIPVAMVKPGDLLRVKPGDKIPVDGIISIGSSAIDESTITGESIPKDKLVGDKVFAGTLNISGSFVMKARQVGSETVLSRIIQMVEQAQSTKAPVQKTVDKIASIFVPVVIAISLLSFTGWLIFGGNDSVSRALLAMVTVLVIACPCALGLATPTALMVGMGKGARDGILIKDAENLERIQKVNAIVLDKTGTLTEGKPVVTDLLWLSTTTSLQQHTKVLIAMEKQSSHPLADAIVEALPKQINGSVFLEKFENIPGKGIKAMHAGKSYFAGNMNMIAEEGVVIDQENLSHIRNLEKMARTVVVFGTANQLLAVIGLADILKPGSARAVKELRDRGIEVYMLTGDNEETAAAIASQANIEKYSAGMMPSGKADFIKKLQDEGKIVGMAGDGINDSHALAQADVSIAMGKGSDIAMEVAGMTIISSDLEKIPRAISLSQLTVRTIRQNLFWAFIYNLIGIPIAAGLLYPVWGFMLNPMIAAAAMALSSVSVVTNSLRLKGMKL